MNNVTGDFITISMHLFLYLNYIMYALDRRKLANHVYSIMKSLRKVAIILQVSHTTVARWLRNPEKKKYTRSSIKNKSCQVIEIIKATIQNDPFISIRKMKSIIEDSFNFSISKELVRTVILKCGFTIKKAKYFSRPDDLEEKIKAFITKRELFKSENRSFFSTDETAFGRNGVNCYGYSKRGSKLIIQRQQPRLTTTSVLAIISDSSIIKTKSYEGSFNQYSFFEFFQDLELPKGAVILLDNVRFHHSKLIKEFVDTYGFELLYTPPYSPWFQPIEGLFSIMKRNYYKGSSIIDSINNVTSEHCNAFFKQSMSCFEMPYKI